jgi:hypothetical protein
MLQWLLDRAQRSVDDVVGSYITKLAAAVPFLIAAGFAVASFTVEVTRVYGTAGGYLVIAMLFCLIGTGAAAAAATASRSSSNETVAEAETAADEVGASSERPIINGENRELLMSIAGTAAPALVPVLRKAIIRHWPLLLLAATLIVLWFMAGRRTPDHSSATAEQ